MRQLEARITELGTESLEEQLQTAMESEEQRATPDFRLTRLISVSAIQAAQSRRCQAILRVLDIIGVLHFDA